MAFTHLHLHTEYSLLDGANKIKELASRLKELNFSACAITDHGNMFGAIDFYKTMRANGIKPIIGMEAYLHEASDISDKNNQRWHLNLFAKNQRGYENLMYLSSQAFMHGFYHKPRINKAMLAKHSEGLICSSACLAGEINWHLNDKEVRRNGRSNASYGARGYEGAKAAALWYKSVFGEDFYLEIMRMGINAQLNIDADILRLGKELNITVIATNDAHYIYKDRAQSQNVFMAINTGDIIAQRVGEESNNDSLRHTMSEIYIKDEAQMLELFADVPEVVHNTQEIVDKCNLELNLGNPTPPNFKFSTEYAARFNLTLPEPDAEFSFANDEVVFSYMCEKGLEQRLEHIDKSEHDKYRARLASEIKIIKDMKFCGYMLIVHDFIKASKDLGVPVGPGRGSAAGALVSYALFITDIDPMPYDLLFERFLNPERVSMPDIDIDFCQKRRGEAIDYVVNKYGRENVAQVITFGKLLAKGVVRDVARVCDVSIKDADYLAKLIGSDDPKVTLKDAYEKNPEIAEFLKELNMRPEYRSLIVHPDDEPGNCKIGDRVWEYALALEGLNRNAGMHAGGVVISNEPLWKKCPIFKQPNKDALVTQYDKDFLEDVDLIKFDFLGLKTLTLIDHAMKLIKQRYGKEINWSAVDFNDPKVYELIQSGNTLGIFQIESSGMQDLNRRLQPDCFEDLIAVLALYRPGPLESGMVDDFIAIKHGRKKAHYAFAELEPILGNTYGVIVYQEQVMQVVQTIGGFSLGGADLVRRAMGKKKLEEMLKLKGEYLEGARKNGFDEQIASDLWELIVKFAAYGFNKSHSAAYAMVSFQTAYLKTYYEAEFMAALLTSEEGNSDKIEQYKEELDRLNIPLLPPNINESIQEFNVVDRIDEQGREQKAIIYGLGSIKGLGYGVISSMIQTRTSKPFSSMADFIERVDANLMNKKVLDALALSGCFCCLNLTRAGVMNSMEYILEELKAKRDFAKNISDSLFSHVAECFGEFRSKINIIDDSEYTCLQIASYEKSLMGAYLSTHPLDSFRHIIRKIEHFKSSQFGELDDGTYDIFCLAAIEGVEFRTSKNGKNYTNIKLIDYGGAFSVMSFNEQINTELAAHYKGSANAGNKELRFYGWALSLKRENQQNSIFANAIVTINEDEIGHNSPAANALGYKVFEKRSAKYKRSGAKNSDYGANGDSNGGNGNGGANYERANAAHTTPLAQNKALLEQARAHEAAQKLQIISIPLFSLQDDIAAALKDILSRVHAPETATAALRQMVVFEFLSDSCSARYSRRYELSAEQIEQIQKLLQIA